MKTYVKNKRKYKQMFLSVNGIKRNDFCIDNVIIITLKVFEVFSIHNLYLFIS